MAEFDSADDIIDFIDFNKLREQKEALIEILGAVKGVKNGIIKTVSEEKINEVQGIIHLIDHIQDYAVDVLGKDENEVFNLED